MDETIAQIVMVTSCTPELAAQYAQLADGDAGTAIQLFFDNGGADLAGPSHAAPPPQPPRSRPTGAGSSRDPIALPDDDEDVHISDDNDPMVTGFRKASTHTNTGTSQPADFEDDEAMARRLQEEMYQSEQNTVRAPIARQAETLVGPAASHMGTGRLDLDAEVEARMQEMQRRRRNPGGSRPGIFSQQAPTSNIWRGEGNHSGDHDFLSEATGGASDASARSNMLARLFQPPWDMMWKGSWDDAREEGKEQKKWMLVNIQDGTVFDCQALNRDLWKNQGVVETIKENFVFLQYSKDDPRADPYIQFYFPGHENTDEYPHVAIVDPRTGEQIKLWSRKIPKASDFLMQIHEFLDRYSLASNARNPVAKRKSEAKKEKPIDQMTEEEMLERALQASLDQQPGGLEPPPGEDPDDLTRSIGDMRHTTAVVDKGDAMGIHENGPAPQPAAVELTPFAQIPSDKAHTEPPAGPGITRVQIRHPGGRVVRRFAQDDPVQRIYEFLKAEPLEGKEGTEFELVSMGKNLIDMRDQTIETAGLKNGTVMVEFLDS